QRRHFVKLSATAAAALVFSRITHAEETGHLMNKPDEVWAQAGDEWFRLKATGSSSFAFNGIDVSLKLNGNAAGVYINAPGKALTGMRFKWKYQVKQAAKALGDSWERTYGDAGWKASAAGIKNAW